MIAQRLLSCIGPEQVDYRHTQFLAFAPGGAGAAPTPLVGQLSGYYRISLTGSGSALLLAGGSAGFTTAPGQGFSGDFLLEIAFDGAVLPELVHGEYSLGLSAGNAYISTDGGSWGHFIPVTPLGSTNHVAIGRQEGAVQAWVNGSRIYRSADAGPGFPSLGGFAVSPGQYSGSIVINAIRLTAGVNLYGDSATITVPTLPLGIV